MLCSLDKKTLDQIQDKEMNSQVEKLMEKFPVVRKNYVKPGTPVCSCGKKYAGGIRIGGRSFCNDCFKKYMRESRWTRKEAEIRDALKRKIFKLNGDNVTLILGEHKNQEKNEKRFYVAVYGNGRNLAHGEVWKHREESKTIEGAELAFEWLTSRIPHGRV